MQRQKLHKVCSGPIQKSKVYFTELSAVSAHKATSWDCLLVLQKQ